MNQIRQMGRIDRFFQEFPFLDRFYTRNIDRVLVKRWSTDLMSSERWEHKQMLFFDKNSRLLAKYGEPIWCMRMWFPFDLLVTLFRVLFLKDFIDFVAARLADLSETEHIVCYERTRELLDCGEYGRTMTIVTVFKPPSGSAGLKEWLAFEYGEGFKQLTHES